MICAMVMASLLSFMELNCENLFDTCHDSMKQDYQYLPDSPRRWTGGKLFCKVRNIAQTILMAGAQNNDNGGIPDIVALCEVENDTVMTMLTRRSPLRTFFYDYLMTSSPDARGIDVALMYDSTRFVPICHQCWRVQMPKGESPTRDVLYVKGITYNLDTLHVMVVHAPSRLGGKRKTDGKRMAVATRVRHAIDSIQSLNPNAHIIVAGDFNAGFNDKSLNTICGNSMTDVTPRREKKHNDINDGNETNATITRDKRHIFGTYWYQGHWETIDHVLLSNGLANLVERSFIMTDTVLIEYDERQGCYKPRRSYKGYHFDPKGVSDHLPIVVRMRL